MTAKAASGALALLLASSALLLLLAPQAAAAPVVGDLSVSSDVVYKDTSFILTGNIAVHAGGRLTLDGVSIQLRMDVDDSRSIRVEAGGELRIVNGTHIYSQFQTVAYALHYEVFVEQGAHFVLQNSTIDYPYWVGVGDASAVISDSTISHGVLGLYGSNLTVDRVTILGSNIGFWLSGHSLIRGSTVEVSTVYGGILDGTSRVEDSSFSGSDAADLALLDNATAFNTTHRSSGRAAILQGNASMERAAIQDMTIAGVAVGDEDFKYGCGIFSGHPQSDWLNLHMFPFFYRVNNTVALKDVTIQGAPLAVQFGRDVWRRAWNTDVMDTCSDPPFSAIAAQPLFNRVDFEVSSAVVVDTDSSAFNGTLRVAAGASLTLRVRDFRFLGTGAPNALVDNGGALVLDHTGLSASLVDFANDSVNASHARSPDLDLFLNAGSLDVRDALLQDVGSSADPAQDAGIVVADGAGPVTFARTQLRNSPRGLTLGRASTPAGASTQVSLDATSFSTSGPAVVLRGGTLVLTNSSLASNASLELVAEASQSEVHLYGSDARVSGPATVSLHRYGFVLARVLWEDLRPAGGLDIVVTDFASGAPVLTMPSAVDGWAAPVFLLFRNSTWDGSTEQGPPPALFTFGARRGNATASSLPLDISQGATVTLTLPDDAPPAVRLNLPPEYYTNAPGGVVTGVAQDFETGVTVVELSVDGGPFLSITNPSTPQLGPLNFSFTLSALDEGVHILDVRAWDSVGNTAEASAYYIVDLHFPTIALSFPFDITTNNRTLNVTGKLNEPGTVTIRGNTTNTTFTDYAFALPVYLDQDSQVVQVLVEDLAGNNQTYTFIARVDQVPPQLEITSPKNGSWVTTPRATLSGLIEFNAQLALNGVPLPVSGTSSFNITAALAEGENLLELTATDLAGNRHSVKLTVFLDSVTPTLDILAPDASRVLPTRDVVLELRTEPGASVTVGNTTVVALTDLVSVPLRLSEGRNVLSIASTDPAGNSVTKGLTLTVDTVAPSISFAGGNHLSTTNATLFFSGLTEPNAVVTVGDYEVQADTYGAFSMPVRLHPGANLLAVRARDAAGNTANATYTVDVAAPPLSQPPGIAAPTVGPALLALAGAAACVVGPYLARLAARRRA